VVQAICKSYPFCFALLPYRSIDIQTFVPKLKDMLDQIHNDGIKVAGVTSNDCLFQKDSLTLADPSSIQQQDESVRNCDMCPGFVTGFRIACSLKFCSFLFHIHATGRLKKRLNSPFLRGKFFECGEMGQDEAPP
jgi:hypothetical protein